MTVAEQSQEDAKLGARRIWRSLAERSPARVAREVLALTFRGSRGELELAAALRLQAALVLVFLAVRCVHLGQAGVDLALAGRSYTTQWLALALGVSCLAESLAVAAVSLGARRLSTGVMLADAAFGLLGLGAMALATTSGPGRAGSLNWMLPYTVATATFLGALVGGDLVERPAAVALPGRPNTRSPGQAPGRPNPHSHSQAGGRPDRRSPGQAARRRVWPLLVALGLGGAYVACAYIPHRLGEDQPGQIWGNAANYLVFFAAGALTVEVARRRVNAMAARNAEVSTAVAEVAREAQWRAVAIDVFGPVLALLDAVIGLPDGELPASVRGEADRLMGLIDAVRPGEAAGLLDEGGGAQS